MTEIPFGKPINPQCEAEISVRVTTIHEQIAEGTLRCGTIFCEKNIKASVYVSGESRNEAELSAEFVLRNVVKKSCPKWKALREAGEVPDTDLPDELMPEFK